MAYWLLKSEPSVFSIDDLAARPAQTERWDGVRNYQARNLLRDTIQRADQALFYHSGTAVRGIVGLVTILRAGYPDPTASDSAPYPRWYCVDVKLIRKLTRVITLSELKRQPALAHWPLLQRGNRLSVLPVTPTQWDLILALE